MITAPKIFPIISLAWFLVGTPQEGEASRPEVAEVLSRLQSKYDQVRSFSADFVQLFRGRNIDLEESGFLLMKKPGKMYWEYREPTRKLFVADGKKAYFYVPRDRQVIESHISLEEADTPLLFLFGKGDVLEDFRVRYEDSEEPAVRGNLFLRLEPRLPQAEFLYVLLEIDSEDYLIHRLSVIEPVGQRNDYVLTNFKANVQIDDRQFRFKIPPGTEVVRQDE